jgi:hypothetical protein
MIEAGSRKSRVQELLSDSPESAGKIAPRMARRHDGRHREGLEGTGGAGESSIEHPFDKSTNFNKNKTFYRSDGPPGVDPTGESASRG